MLSLRFLLSVFFLSFSLAQSKPLATPKEEVLLKELKWVQGISKVNTLNALSAHYLNFYLDSKHALIYSEQALKLSQKLSYQKGEIESLINIGLSHSQTQNSKLAKEYLTKSFQISKESYFKRGIVLSLNGLVALYRDQSLYEEAFSNASQALSFCDSSREKALHASIIFEMGRVYLQQANYLKATACFLQASKETESGGDYALQMLSFTNLGIIHQKLKEYKKALNYHLKSLNIHNEFAQKGSVMSLVNIGLTYYQKQNFSKALAYTQLAYKEAIRGENKWTISTCLTNLGYIFLRLKKYEKSLDHFNKAMALHRSINYEEGIIDASNGLSELYVATGKYKQAIAYATQAVGLIKKTGIKHRYLESYEQLHRAYARVGNYNKAYYYQSKLRTLQDTLIGEESTSKVSLLQNQFELEKKQNQINLLAKEKQLQQAEISKQNLIRWALLIGLVVVFIFSMLLLMAYRGLAKRNREITQISEELRLTQQKLSSALSLGLVGTWVLDKKQNLLFIDENLARMLGFDASPEGIPFEDFLNSIYLDDKSKAEELVSANHKEYESEYRIIHPCTGGITWLYVRGKAELDEKGNVISCAGVGIDITDKKDADRHKNEFLSIASHELRTPLASVKGYLQLAERMLNVKHSASVFVTKAAIQLKKLERLTADLMDVSRISTGKLLYEYTEFNFSEIIKEVVEGIQQTVTSHTILLEETVNVNLTGDKYRIEQVLNNFLSNAIKYSPDANKVILKAHQEGNNVIVSIKDFGIGIEQEHLSRLYERFYRVRSEAKNYDGLGLGLFIASEILKQHTGRFWVKSQLGQGSTFFFQLPINQDKKLLLNDTAIKNKIHFA